MTRLLAHPGLGNAGRKSGIHSSMRTLENIRTAGRPFPPPGSGTQARFCFCLGLRWAQGFTIHAALSPFAIFRAGALCIGVIALPRRSRWWLQRRPEGIFEFQRPTNYRTLTQLTLQPRNRSHGALSAEGGDRRESRRADLTCASECACRVRACMRGLLHMRRGGGLCGFGYWLILYPCRGEGLSSCFPIVVRKSSRSFFRSSVDLVGWLRLA